MYITTIKKWLRQTLFERIPTYLIAMLENYSEQVGLWNSSLPSTPQRVYDLLNCGPDARFVSGIRYNLITSNCQYGAGANKVNATLEEQEIYLDFSEVETIHSGYWNLFSKVKEFGRGLQTEWRRNGGYIVNGMGRPMSIGEDYIKDSLNRFMQSTGHDILVRYIYLLSLELDRREIPWSPLIIDWHDSTAIEVPEEYKDAVIDVFNSSMAELNAQLGGTVTLKGTPSWGYNLSDIKEPET